MKIAQSNVMMESSREYSRSGSRSGSTGVGDFSQIAFNALNGRRDEYVSDEGREELTNNYGSEKRKQGGLKDQYLPGKFELESVMRSEDLSEDISEEFSMQYDLFVLLFKRLMYGGAFGAMGGSFAFSSAYNSVFQQRVVTYEEHESTEFHAKGQALTEDGRTIDFKVDISMSRSYMEYMDVSIPIATNALLDPLVVNVGSGVANLSDQRFRFDLDMDGIEEEIPMPGKHTGFLALDDNGDGVINNGAELFGAKSGDGFAELGRFDLDGNGWIDENDNVFERLKVWFKDEDGKDILMNLKEADIGAIYLGEASTEFSFKDAPGRTSGVIRSTGFFLKESIGIGTVQHVDLSVSGDNSSEEIDRGTNGISPEAPAGSVIMINNPSQKITEDNGSDSEDISKIRERQRQLRELEKKERQERIDKRRLRQKEYEEKRLEELYERKERLEKELDDSVINRLFLDRMEEVV